MANRYYQTTDKEEEVEAEMWVPDQTVYGSQRLQTADSEGFGTKSYQMRSVKCLLWFG